MHDRKLFEKNHYSECSRVLSKIGFASFQMKVYLKKFSFLGIHEAVELLDLGKPIRH